MNPKRFPLPFYRTRRRTGMTLVELMFASGISAMLAVGLMSLTVGASRIGRSVFYQERSLQEGKTAIEWINREIRQGCAPLVVLDDSGNASTTGNRIEYSRPDETDRKRSLELVTVDGDIMTPWDNELIFDPDTSKGGDEVVLAKWLTPLEDEGAFAYHGATSALQVQMRCGDSIGVTDTHINDARSGPGMQGMEINIYVAPRN